MEGIRTTLSSVWYSTVRTVVSPPNQTRPASMPLPGLLLIVTMLTLCTTTVSTHSFVLAVLSYPVQSCPVLSCPALSSPLLCRPSPAEFI